MVKVKFYVFFNGSMIPYNVGTEPMIYSMVKVKFYVFFNGSMIPYNVGTEPIYSAKMPFQSGNQEIKEKIL